MINRPKRMEIEGERHVRTQAKTETARKGSGRSSFQRRLGSVFGPLALLLVATLVPTSASATPTRFTEPFSPIDGSGTGAVFTSNSLVDVAIDESSGNVFVATQGGAGEVRIFGAEGDAPANITSPYRITGFSSNLLAIEVDNSSTSPMKGAVYIAESDKVKRFVRNPGTEVYDPAGQLLGSPALSSIADIAVDSKGNIFVACSQSGTSSRTIVKFNSAGTQTARYSTGGGPPKEGFPDFRPRPVDVAVDSVGNLFYRQLEFNPQVVWKYPANGAGEIDQTVFTKLVQSSSNDFGGLAMDPGANRIFVTYGEPGTGAGLNKHEVVQYNTISGEKHISFGANFLTDPRRIAVNSATNRVYVIDASKLIVFGGEVPVPTIIAGSPTNNTGAQATLNATINPENVPVTGCTFEYGETTAYGKSKPCQGAIPTDSEGHPVSAALTNLLPNGRIYHYRVVLNATGLGVVTGEDSTFATADTFVASPASAVTNTQATLNGTVRLEGVALTECKFEYGLTVFYGNSVACNPPFSSIPNDFEDHPISASLTGLTPNATYHFRVVAKNAGGTIIGSDRTFRTLGPPLVAGQSALPMSPSTAVLSSYVNPGGVASSYHFEWGAGTGYGTRLPKEFDLSLGSDNVPVKATVNLSSLEEGAVYHYRIVAENSFGVTYGPDQIFSTDPSNASCFNGSIRAAQISSDAPKGSTYLPMCMALEMVSPPKKYNQPAFDPSFSPTGESVRFTSYTDIGGTPQLGSIEDRFAARRTPSGWVTHSLKLPPSIDVDPVGRPCTFNSDLSHWTSLAASPLQPSQAVVTPYTGAVGGVFSPLGPTLAPVNIDFGSFWQCEGGAVDASQFFFGYKEAAFLPGDPVPTLAGGGSQGFGWNVYEAYLDDDGDPTVELLNRDKDGTVWGGVCAAHVGWSKGPRGAYRGAISSDASLVYFTTRPSQGSGSCNATSNRLRVMKRLRTPGGVVISPLISSECSRVSPACATSNGDDNFMAASREGDKVFFTTTRQLANSDLDSGAVCSNTADSSAESTLGCDIYLYDGGRPVGSRLTQISAGDATAPTPGKGAEVLGLVDVAGDGSHAYFVAKGLLTTNANARGMRAQLGGRNLYLYQRDASYPNGRVVFIATLGSGEGDAASGPGQNGMAAVPVLGEDLESPSIGGDGHILVFGTRASLTPDDTDGGNMDGYRYDADTGSLERFTRAAPGGSDNGAFDATAPIGQGFSSGTDVPPQEVSFNRSVSEDGRTIVFSTSEALDSRDNDGGSTRYVWHDGIVTALPRSLQITVNMAGDEVAFVTASPLLPQDSDSARDVYITRADGGFPLPVAPSPCQGEGCQGPPAPQPPSQSSASETFAGAGNVETEGPSCKKGYVRRHGKCVKPCKKGDVWRHGRCVKKPARKSANKRYTNVNRRAGK